MTLGLTSEESNSRTGGRSDDKMTFAWIFLGKLYSQIVYSQPSPVPRGTASNAGPEV